MRRKRKEKENMDWSGVISIGARWEKERNAQKRKRKRGPNILFSFHLDVFGFYGATCKGEKKGEEKERGKKEGGERTAI